MPGGTAGIGGISYAAIYTTVLPAQGQGFELYAIAAAVIGGTSLAGGIGTIWGTIIGVFIMSVLATGLPALSLQSHWQTFFTGVIVIGAVLLDMYRNRMASEVRIEKPADVYRASMLEKIAGMKRDLVSLRVGGNGGQAAAIRAQIAAARNELRLTLAKMKAEDRQQQLRVRAEAKAADREFAEVFKRRELSQQEETERRSL